jgi:hypothetical protein
MVRIVYVIEGWTSKYTEFICGIITMKIPVLLMYANKLIQNKDNPYDLWVVDS